MEVVSDGNLMSGSFAGGSSTGSTRQLDARPTVGVGPPVARGGLALLTHARAVLAEAAMVTTAAERFQLSHLAALRTAAALFAERARPVAGRRRLVSAWTLMETMAPEYGDWAAYFAAGAAKRAAVEAGAVSVVSERDADDQFRAASEFLVLVERALGLLVTPLATPLAS